MRGRTKLDRLVFRSRCCAGFVGSRLGANGVKAGVHIFGTGLPHQCFSHLLTGGAIFASSALSNFSDGGTNPYSL